jgi:hypothetical protein
MLNIVTPVVNNPRFIEAQHHTLNTFVRGDYRFIVYNDAKTWSHYTNTYYATPQTLRQDIHNTCKRLDIECIPIDNTRHKNTSFDGCGETANIIIANYVQENKPVLVIDSDMFVISEFHTSKFQDLDLATVPQSRGKIKYFWNGIFYLNMPILSNKHLLNMDRVDKTDFGGKMHKFYECTPDLKEYTIPHLSSLNWTAADAPFLQPEITKFCTEDSRNHQNRCFSEIYDQTFLHFRASSGWNKETAAKNASQADKLCDVLMSLRAA